MELEVQHENQTIILWLRSGCRMDLSLLYELGKTWRYRVVVIRSGFGSLINNTSTLLWFNRGTPIGRDSHGCALAASLHWRKGEDYNNKDIRGKEILIWKQELKSRIAGYCRISVDVEADRDNTSIENQKDIISDYVQRYFPDREIQSKCISEDFYARVNLSGNPKCRYFLWLRVV